MALGQPMRAAYGAAQRKARPATPQTPSAAPRPGMGVRPAPPMRPGPPGPPGQMQTAGPPMGSFNNLQIPGRPPIGMRPPMDGPGGGKIAGPAGPAGWDPRGAMPPRGIPGGEMPGGMGGGMNDLAQRLQVQRAAGVFDKPQPAGPDPREMAMARMAEMGGQFGGALGPKPPMPQGPPPQMQSIQPPGMMPPDRQRPDMAAMRERMMQMQRGGGGPVY